MDIVVKARHTQVPDRLRDYVAEKVSRASKLDGKVSRVDVEITREKNPRQSAVKDRVEITCITKGPVLRAEASAADPFSAVDLAWSKLDNQLRRAAARRRAHKGARPLKTMDGLDAVAPAGPVSTVPDNDGDKYAAEVTDGPLVVREKVHAGSAITLDQALYEMELVGHDFYLFLDVDAGLPSVVYRRRGYDYGVIRLKS